MHRTGKAQSVQIFCLTICLTTSVWAGTASNSLVFDVRGYGARGDGDSVDTKAIQDTIDACHAAGGGAKGRRRGGMR